MHVVGCAAGGATRTIPIGMLARLRRAWKRHGPRKFIHLVVLNLRHLLRSPFERENRSFDLAHGTETGQIREIGSLEIDSPNAIHAVRYEPSPAELVEEVLTGLRVRFSDYVFVDYGAGKGRVVMMASQFPFARILGVEFSPELHEIAQRNIETRLSGDSRVTLVRMDVLDFEPPDEPLVCYFYNPFDEFVLEEVLERLMTSFRRNPRSVLAIYVDARHAEVFEASGWILHEQHGPARIYELKVTPRPAAGE